ncbi:hypothetical protein V1525DRAFT_450264 [Lipomyces kononenkoae]|uniref:Uncharacterized protein n=1 Tax=Lipomyces kononenkoae TaxID=34357 RepID=A0ACC3T265_LIPKO
MSDPEPEPVMSETLDEILARHRKESRDLQAAVTSLKKSATKGEKRKKKEALAKCEQMEKDLKTRHEAELAAAGNNTKSNDMLDSKHGDPAAGEDTEDEISPDKLLAQLALDVGTAVDPEPVPTLQQQQQPQQKGPKKNRQKDRLARRKAAMDQMTAEAAVEAANTPDLRKIELENVTALTEKLGLIQYDIIPDGHCLFAAIADQLRIRHDIATTVAELRSKAAAHIRSDPDTFAPFLFDEATLSLRDLNAYCVDVERTAIWGGDMEILALSKEYDCPVSVVMSGKARLRMNEAGTRPELWLAYYRHSYGLGEHYNSLRDKII